MLMADGFTLRPLIRVPLLGLIEDTLWLFNIAMDNGPFIDDLPITNGDFPWLC